MQALRYENNRLALAEVAVPASGGEALVRVTLSGVCNTDVEIVRGYAGFQGTIGHEFVGVVVEAADKTLIGERVVGEINAGCGRCVLCLGGDPRHCPERTVLGIHGRDGAHAEFLRLPAINLFPVPANVPDEQAVFTEPLAAAYGILERVNITEADKVAVIGDGKLGLLCAQALALTGANVAIIGKHKEKMDIAARRGCEPILLEAAQKLSRSFTVVAECSGHAGGFELALNLLRPRGVLVLKSTFHGATPFDARIVVDEISVVGSRCGRFAPALELLAQNAVDVESMISEEYPLGKGVHAMQRAQTKGVMKVLLRL
jgi:threonine dehydrogenase-like Zn-dependent dehydrogenase